MFITASLLAVMEKKKKKHPGSLRKMNKLWHFHSMKYYMRVNVMNQVPEVQRALIAKSILPNKKTRCTSLRPVWYLSLSEIFTTSQKHSKMDWKHITSMKIVASGEQRGGGEALEGKQHFNFSNSWSKKNEKLECRTKTWTFAGSGWWGHRAHLSFSAFFQCFTFSRI